MSHLDLTPAAINTPEEVDRFTVRGTHRAVFQGVPPTGNRIHYEGISIYRVVGGKVAEIWIAADSLGLMQQIGALPTPGQEPR